MESKLIERFERELKDRTRQRASGGHTESRTLIDGFKYFDMQNTGLASFLTFNQVVRTRMSIASFTDYEMRKLFDHFANGGLHFDYRAFTSKLYGELIEKSTNGNVSELRPKTPNAPANGKSPQANHQVNLMEKIYNQLKEKELCAFIKLYRTLQDSMVRGDISQLVFQRTLDDMKVESGNYEAIHALLDKYRRGTKFDLDLFFVEMITNYSNERQNKLMGLLDKQRKEARPIFDIENMLMNIRATEGKIAFGDSRPALFTRESVDSYLRLASRFVDFKAKLSSVKNHQEIQLNVVFAFLFASPFFTVDDVFNEFLDFLFSASSTPADRVIANSSNNMKPLANNGNINSPAPDPYIAYLCQMLDKSGVEAYVNFYFHMKNTDSGKHGAISSYEFASAVTKSRLNLSKEQSSAIFLRFPSKKSSGALDVERLMLEIVPRFDEEKRAIINHLHSKLLLEEYKGELSSSRLVSNYHPKSNIFTNKSAIGYNAHSNGDFATTLQKFLLAFTGQTLNVPHFALVRFIEFYARGVTSQELMRFVDECFLASCQMSLQSVERLSVGSWDSGMNYKGPKYNRRN
jgi:hypothetical protein